jgi:hypothetical protein
MTSQNQNPGQSPSTPSNPQQGQQTPGDNNKQNQGDNNKPATSPQQK